LLLKVASVFCNLIFMAVPAGRDRLVSAHAVAIDITEINAAINNFFIQPPNLVLILTLDQLVVTDNSGQDKGTTLDTAFRQRSRLRRAGFHPL
jgi:hypothetical protein